MKATVVAFGEIYSENVGDGVIYDCIAELMRERGICVIPGDLSLRSGYRNKGQEKKEGEKVSILRRVVRYPVRSSLNVRRSINAIKWAVVGRSRFIRRYKDLIEGCDGVIIGGGQIIVDRQLYFPLAISAVASMARDAKIPVAVFSCGVDESQGKVARLLYRRLLQSVQYISVRDKSSAVACSLIDKSKPVEVHPDVGFLASQTYNVPPTTCEKVLGINIMPYATVASFPSFGDGHSKSKYLEFWWKTVNCAIAGGWTVKIMTNGASADDDAALAVYAPFLEDKRVSLLPCPKNPESLTIMLQGVEALIASRMHAGIVAYSLGKRVIPLVWDDKVENVWSEADRNVVPVSFNDILSGDISPESLLKYLGKANETATQNALDGITSKIEICASRMAEVFVASKAKRIGVLEV